MHLPLPPWWWFYGRRYHCLCQHWVVFNHLLSLDNYPTAKIYQTLACRACRFQPSSTSLGILQFVCFFSAPGNREAFCLFTSIVISSDYDCIMQPKAFSSIHLFLITKTQDAFPSLFWNVKLVSYVVRLDCHMILAEGNE